jgi:signal peptidase I
MRVLTAVAVVAVLAGLGWARRRLVVVQVDGVSMTPAYADGDRLLVRRVTGGIRPGQVVVYGPPIVPDDSGPPPGPDPPPGPAPDVSPGPPPGPDPPPGPGSPSGPDPPSGPERTAGRMWLVKRVVAVPDDPVPAGLRAAAGADRVPPGHFLVLGDNPEESHDSRHQGLIPHARIRGIVIRKIGI